MSLSSLMMHGFGVPAKKKVKGASPGVSGDIECTYTVCHWSNPEKLPRNCLLGLNSCLTYLGHSMLCSWS